MMKYSVHTILMIVTLCAICDAIDKILTRCDRSLSFVYRTNLKTRKREKTFLNPIFRKIKLIALLLKGKLNLKRSKIFYTHFIETCIAFSWRDSLLLEMNVDTLFFAKYLSSTFVK